MADGYWLGIWSVIWQSTLAGSALVTLAYWIRMPFGGYSIIMPVYSIFILGLIAILAGLISALPAFLAGYLMPTYRNWIGSALFFIVFCLYVMSRDGNLQQIDDALGPFRFLLLVIVAGFLWFRVIAPVRT